MALQLLDRQIQDGRRDSAGIEGIVDQDTDVAIETATTVIIKKAQQEMNRT